jgi:hypothetical protein
MMRWLMVTLLVLGCLIPPLWATRMRFWRQHQPAHYEKAVFHNTVLASDGSIRLGRQVKRLAELEAAQLWCLVEDAQGQLYLGSGNEGKIFRVDAAGRVSLLYKSEEPQIFSLAALPDGGIAAGTGPGGLVLEIKPDGNARVLTRTGENYVWSLAYDPRQDVLYAGTGPHGKILRITRSGQSEVLYATRQEHVLALVLAEHHLYAATAKRGLVLRYDLASRQASVLFEAPHHEIRSLCRVGETIFAGTAVPLKRTASTGASSNANVGGQAVKENVVYAIAPDGSVREIFHDREMILALAAANADRLLLATGGQGQIIEYDLRQGLFCKLVQLEAPQIPALWRRKDGSVVFASGDPARLYVVQPDYYPQGHVISEVLDARQLSRLVRLHWLATTPPGTQVRVALRSGNTSTPDDTWSPWSAEITESESAALAVPAARFVQYRVTLSTEKPQQTPILHSLSLGYQHVNLPPEITTIEVPDDTESQPESAKAEAARKLRFKWSASDPNEDQLVYDVYFRKEGWSHWVELARDLEKPELEWDSTTVPSGVYRLKVVASDRRENAPTEARQAERISPPFVVDNVPPQVEVRLERWEGEAAWITVQASDNLTRLTQAAWSLDGGKWQPLFPTDGVFDKRNKTFRFRVGPLMTGTHVVLVRVRDAAGNIGTGDIVFEK